MKFLVHSAYRNQLKVEGLIGITLDNNDVFLVNIAQVFGLNTLSIFFIKFYLFRVLGNAKITLI